MPTLKVSCLTYLPIFSLLVSWTLACEYIPVQAQISINQQQLPQLQQGEFNQFSGKKYSQYNQKFERYFVYIDSSNNQILYEVRQIEPDAYIRHYNGRNIIQSGVFNELYNAQLRIKELELHGIPGARIVNSANVDVTSDQRSYNNQEKTDFYYVVIPSSANNLSSFATDIRQKVGTSINVIRRTQPIGTHIAVGPFRDRLEAEQWNGYLKDSGYGNARVYYGK